MGVYARPDSPFYWIWLEGAPPKQARVNTKIPIGATPELRKHNRALAEKVYSALMGDRARARFKLPMATSGRTFLEHRTWYAEHVTSKKRGHVRERSMLKQLGEFFDTYALDAIDKDLREEWRTWRAEDVGASTINREDAILKHLLTTAVPKYLEKNPLERLPRLRQRDIETRILSREDEQQLLAVAARDSLAYAAVLCGLDALMRRGSVAALERAQDHEATLTLLNAKAGTYKVPVSARLRKALDAIAGDDTRYFEAYKPHIDIELSKVFTELCTVAGIRIGRAVAGVTFHSLRHTGASRMLEAGVDIKTVMRIGGWKNMKTLERYLHPTDAAARQAVESIGAAPVSLTTRKKSSKNSRKHGR